MSTKIDGKGQIFKVEETPRKKIDLSYHATTPKTEDKKKLEEKPTYSEHVKVISKAKRRDRRSTRSSPFKQYYLVRYNYSQFHGY